MNASNKTSNKSYFHRGGEQPLLGLTIPEHFSHVAQNYADHEAVVFAPKSRRLNYSQLSIDIDKLASGCLGMGFRQGALQCIL